MIINRNLTTNKSQDKMSLRRKQQQQTDDDCQQDIEDEENGNKSDNGSCQMMWSGILYRIKYKSSLGYKPVYNWAMLYLTMLIMTGLKVLNDSENNQTNP